MSLRVRVGDRGLIVSDHAIVRYQERVRPTLTVLQVGVELARVLPGAVIGGAPAWVSERVALEAAEWLLVGDGIACPMQRNLLTTCLVRGEVGEDLRAARQDTRRREDRDGFRRKHKAHGKVARSARRARQAARDALDG